MFWQNYTKVLVWGNWTTCGAISTQISSLGVRPAKICSSSQDLSWQTPSHLWNHAMLCGYFLAVHFLIGYRLPSSLHLLLPVMCTSFALFVVDLVRSQTRLRYIADRVLQSSYDMFHKPKDEPPLGVIFHPMGLLSLSDARQFTVRQTIHGWKHMGSSCLSLGTRVLGHASHFEP